MGGHAPSPSPTFLRSRKEKGIKGKKESFKVETIKKLSPKSKCYCFSHSRVSRIQRLSLSCNHGGRQYFSVFHDPSTLKSISPALYCISGKVLNLMCSYLKGRKQTVQINDRFSSVRKV